MATNVGSLNINIQAGTAQFDQAMNKVQQSLKSAVVSGSALGSAIGNLFEKLSEQAVDLAKEMYEFARSLIDTEEQMLRLAQATGTTTEKFSTLAFAGKFSSVSTEELAMSMTHLEKTMADAANGNLQARQAFQALGVTITDAKGNLRDTGDVFVDVAKKLSGYRDDANKARLMQDIFGKSGAQLIAMMNDVGTNYDALKKKAQELGVITGTNAAQAASDLNAKLTELQERLRGAAQKLLDPMIPSLKLFIEDVGNAITNVGKLIDKLGELGKQKLPIGEKQYEVVDVIRAADQIKKEQDEEQVNRLKALFGFLSDKTGLNLGAWWTDSVKVILGSIPKVTADIKELQPYVEAAKKAREEQEKRDKDKDKDKKKDSVKLPPDPEIAKTIQQYYQRLTQIRDAITAQKLLNEVVGQGNAAQAVANGLNKAQADITQLNNARKEKGIAQLTKEEEANLKRQAVSEELNKLFTDYNTSLDQQVQAAELAQKQQENLTAATAQGADAVEQAHVANQILAADWGKESSILDLLNGKVDKRNEAFAKAAESARQEQTIQRIQQLQLESAALEDELKVTKEMTTAILQDDAARQLAERHAFEARQAAEVAAARQRGAHEDEIDRLKAVQKQQMDVFDEQQRQQTLQQAKQDIQGPKEVRTERESNLNKEAKALMTAQNAAMSYGQALTFVAQMHEAAIEEQQQWVHALLASQNAMDGVKAFFHDLQANAKTAAQDVHDVLMSAFEGFSDYLAKVLTGTKASFSDFLRSLAEMIVKAEITKVLTQLLTASQGKGGFLGALGSVVGAFAGGKQGGGWISSDKAYLVGESGPEIITGAAGYVHSSMQTRGMLGGQANVVNYSIDARGTDPVLTERRTRAAILAAHQSSVITSVQTSDELMKRKPTRIGGK